MAASIFFKVCLPGPAVEQPPARRIRTGAGNGYTRSPNEAQPQVSFWIVP